MADAIECASFALSFILFSSQYRILCLTPLYIHRSHQSTNHPLVHKTPIDHVMTHSSLKSFIEINMNAMESRILLIIRTRSDTFNHVLHTRYRLLRVRSHRNVLQRSFFPNKSILNKFYVLRRFHMRGIYQPSKSRYN